MLINTRKTTQPGRRTIIVGIVIWCAACLLAGCDSTPSYNALSNSGETTQDDSQTGTTLARFTLPNEISAVPAGVDSNGNTTASVIYRAAMNPGTDYTNAVTQRYIEEKSLHHCETLESILELLAQTNYTDEIDQGPYRVIVAIREAEGGRMYTHLKEWVVQSDSIRENGRNALRIRIWMEVEYAYLKGEFKVFTPPTRNDDGSYENYGEWTINLKYDETGEEDYITASCTTTADGLSLIKLYEKFSGHSEEGGEDQPTRVKAIMYRSASSGYGKVFYPDLDEYYCPDFETGSEIPHKTSVYAYDQDTLAVQVGSGSVVYKDRNTIVPVTLQYGVYDSETGNDVLKTRNFGFPVKYTENNMTRHAYYAAFDGRHELINEQGLPLSQGTVVTREDTPPDQTPVTYTVGETFEGVLVKSNYEEARLDDIKGVPLECWVDQEFNLHYNFDAEKWYYCPRVDWSTDPPTCLSGDEPFDNIVGLRTLIVGKNNFMKMVEIWGWDETDQQEVQFVYEAADTANGITAGFYEAETVLNDKLEPITQAKIPRVKLDTENITHLYIYIGGSIYIEYQGSVVGWVEKQLDYFDQRVWKPVFVKDGDQPFVMPEGKEFYINSQGVNYVVAKTADGFEVSKELQTVCNPVNADKIVPDGTVFYDSWNPDYNSTYEFITDPSSQYYLMLVYRSIGDNDRDVNGEPLEGAEVGKPARSIWGLEAEIDGENEWFNWERPEFDGDWGTVTFLMNGATYILIDDPMIFSPITVTRLDGSTRKLTLMYDGWLSGVPYAEDLLEEAGWQMTDAIKEKVINLPAGTTVQESSTGISYLIKPLEISLFLTLTGDPGNLNIIDAQNLDLAEVPIYAEHGMGNMPENAELKYIEGVPLEEDDT